MKVERHSTGDAFLAAAGGYLGAREAEHCLLLGIAAGLRVDEASGSAPGPAPYLATLETAGRVVGAALMTPPHRLVVSCLDEADLPAAVDALAADLAAFPSPTPGVIAPLPEGRAFAAAWCPPRGLVARVTTSERIHRLERLVPPTGVRGTYRIATLADRDLLAGWVAAFILEAFGRPDEDDARRSVDRALEHGTRTFYLWEVDGRVVSLAAVTGPTPNGARIGPVYTPPQARGHGYASAVTAAATQAVLDEGRRFVFLLTDVTNPTSNKIYRQLGYEPVIDVDDLRFEAGLP